jgi:hypothetical protein
LTWLETLLAQHAELESPLSFWYWGGLASISAIVKDNVWLDRQIYNLYPNIYVMFHAESGLKKGPPISMAKQLVKIVGGTRVISGRSSIQGILKELGTAYTQPGGKTVNKSVAFICSSELTSSIVEDKVATDILTDLYDRQYNIGEWRSLLKMEQFNLKDPTITMLTATNEAHSDDFFARKDVHGGYFARTFIVTESQRNRVNSLLTHLTNPPNYAKSAEYLKDLAKLNGPFRPLASDNQEDEFTILHKDGANGEFHYYSEAGFLYEKWYTDFIETIARQEIKDETGTLNRFGDSVLKVAMLLSLSRSAELYIDTISMQSAIDYCTKLIGNIREVTLGRRGKSDSKDFKNILIKEFVRRDNHQASRTLLMKQMWMHYNTANEFDEMLLSLEQAGIIKIVTMGNQIIYTMPDYQVQEYVRYFEGRDK